MELQEEHCGLSTRTALCTCHAQAHTCAAARTRWQRFLQYQRYRPAGISLPLSPESTVGRDEVTRCWSFHIQVHAPQGSKPSKGDTPECHSCAFQWDLLKRRDSSGRDSGETPTAHSKQNHIDDRQDSNVWQQCVSNSRTTHNARLWGSGTWNEDHAPPRYLCGRVGNIHGRTFCPNERSRQSQDENAAKTPATYNSERMFLRLLSVKLLFCRHIVA